MAAYSPFEFGGDLGPLASTGRDQVRPGQARSLDSGHYRKPTSRAAFAIGPEYIGPIAGGEQPMLSSGSSEIPAFDMQSMLKKLQSEAIAHYQQLGYDLQSLMSMGPDDYLVFASDLSNPNDPIIPLLALTYTNADQSVVTVDIRDTQQKSSAFALRFRKVASTGWIIESSQPPSSEVLPLESNPLSLTLAAWMVFITQSLIVGKVNESSKISRNKGPTIQEREGGCMDHDLVCTLGAFGDARRLNLLGILIIDIFDCCVKHDLDLWCARDDGRTANQDVIGCVRSKILEAIWTLPFPLSLIVYYALALPLLGLEGLARLITLIGDWTGEWVSPPYVGGGAGWSCLCDGNEPTVSCDEPCRNLCEKFGRPQTCFKCSWSCQYDRGSGPNQGRFIGVQFNRDPRGLPCCPETRLDPNNDCQDTEEEARASCDTCYTCHWECERDWKGHQKRVLYTDTVNNLPCCPGTEQEPKGNWCVEDVKRGTKGIV